MAEHVANFLVVAMAIVATTYVWRGLRELEIARPLFIGTWVLALGWLASVLVAVPQGQVQVSAAWAVAAAAAIVVGLVSGEVAIRWVGLGTLGVVLVKLLTVDLAAVDTFWRVGLFLLVGLGLLRLGYVLPALAKRYNPDGPAPDGEQAGQVEVG